MSRQGMIRFFSIFYFLDLASAQRCGLA